MERNIYNAFYQRIRNVQCSKILARCCYLLYLLYYCIQKRQKKHHEKTKIDLNMALQQIERVSPKPDITFSMNEEDADVTVDLTVIVPVYNYRTVLKQCLDSIQKQETKYSYEMIFVDDGSTDGSAVILNEYKTDKRISIFRQENKGISSARNLALNQAGGKYIMFVDCDDYLEPDAIEVLLNQAYNKDCDIVEAAYYTFTDNLLQRRNYVQQEVFLKGQDYNKLMKYTGYPWAKVFKRELFQKVRFPEKAWFEDTLVKMILFRECQNYAYISKPLYGYRKYDGNFTETQVKSTRGIEHYWMLCWMAELSEKNHIGKKESLYTALLYHLGAIYQYRIESVEENLQQAAFIAGRSLLENYRPLENGTGRRPYMYREIEMAYQQRDFAWWKLICRYM